MDEREFAIEHNSVGSEEVVHEELIPKLGMLFDSVKEAYDCYNEYARLVGFSIKIKRTNKHRGDHTKIVLQTLCCSCEGAYTKVKTPTKKREERRFGCMAKFQTTLNKEGKYVLSKLIVEHTHSLVPPSNSYLLRSHRGVKDSQAGIMKKMRDSGLKPSDIYYYFCSEVGGAENLNFIKSDCNNLLQRVCEKIRKKGDAVCLLDFFKQKKQENKHFFYSFLTNKECELRCVFFCDALSRRDYGLFGDVICFDTTFRTNNYNLVCAPIVGINNHGQTVIFMCGLLEGETSDAVIWMFRTFLEVMGGKQPKTIFTDQSQAIVKAISVVFPEAHHGLCLWHILNNGTKHLGKLIGEFPCFPQRFKDCIYNPEIEEEFEESWKLLLKDYGLERNDWLIALYKLRRKWAQVHARDFFCADITTTQRSESINRFLKNYFTSSTILREFVDQYNKAMASRRQRGKEADNKTQQTIPNLWSKWLVESEASKVYTRTMFHFFQDEYKKTLDLCLTLEKEEDTIHIYVVAEMGRKRSRTVTFNVTNKSVQCICRKFEFHGVLCCHALKLFRDLNFSSLPSQYYLKRWIKNVTDEVVYDSYGEAIPCDIDPESTARYSELSHISQRHVVKDDKGEENVAMQNLQGGSSTLNHPTEGDMSNFIDGTRKENTTTSHIQGNTLASNKSSQEGHHNSSMPNAMEDGQVKNPPTRRRPGQPKGGGRIKGCLEKRPRKKKGSSKEMDGKGEKNEAMQIAQGGSLTLYQPMEGNMSNFVGGTREYNRTTSHIQGETLASNQPSQASITNIQEYRAPVRRLDFSY